MGFTGKKALKYKSDFYDAFKAMESFIKERQGDALWLQTRNDGKVVRLSMTSAISNLVDYAKSQGSTNAEYYYANITKMEYKALTFIEKATDKLGNNFRDTLDNLQLAQLRLAEDIVERVILLELDKGTHYKDIYKLCKESVIAFSESMSMLRKDSLVVVVND